MYEVGTRVRSRQYGEGTIVSIGEIYSVVDFDKPTNHEDPNGYTTIANFQLHEIARPRPMASAKGVEPMLLDAPASTTPVDEAHGMVIPASGVKPEMLIRYYGSFFVVTRVESWSSGTKIHFQYGSSVVTREYPPDSFVQVTTRK